MLAIFDVLLALAVIVSLFGIVNALVLSTFERPRELGMLRAIGMTRRQVRRMVRHESIITALIGAALGHRRRARARGDRHRGARRRGPDLRRPRRHDGRARGRRAIAGVLAAMLPARRAARLGPLTALAYE